MREFTVVTAGCLTLGGIGLVIGWIWVALANPARSTAVEGWVTMNLLLIGSGLLVAVGLPAIHLYQAEAAGWLSAVAVTSMAVGYTIAYLAVQTTEMLEGGLVGPVRWFPALAVPAFLGGGALLAIASLRAGVVPAAFPVLFLLGGAAALVTLAPVPMRVVTLASVPANAVLAAWGAFILAKG